MAKVSDHIPDPDQDDPVQGATPTDRRAAHIEPSAAEVAAEAAAIYPDTSDAPPTAEEIADEAYKIYQDRGGAPGLEEDDWLEAERRLRGRRRPR